MKIFDWSDRFVRGLAAGLAAGAIKDVFNLVVFTFGLTTLTYEDFMGTMLYGHKPNTLAENLFAWGAEGMFAGFAGVIISYLFLGMKSKNYILKGWASGVGLYFAAYFITSLFKVPGLVIIPFKTVLSNFIGSSLYGILLGLMLHWMDKRVEAEEKGVSKARVRKYYLSPAPARKAEPEKKKFKKPVKLKKAKSSKAQ